MTKIAPTLPFIAACRPPFLYQMRSTAKVWALATAILFGAPAAASADLILNGGFETGNLTDWTCSALAPPNGNCSVTGFSHTGAYAFEGFNNSGFGTLTQTISTTPGTTYDFSVWAKTSEAAPNVAEYSLDGGSAVAIPLTNNAYTETTDSFIATGTSAAITLLFSTKPQSGVVYFDDVSVTPAATPLPAALPLFAKASARSVGAGSGKRAQVC